MVEALKFHLQLFVVDAEEVEHGGVQVADVDRVLDDVVAEVVSIAVVLAALDAAAGEPAGEAAGMMVAPVHSAADAALPEDGAAEFADEHDECVIK